MVSNPDESVGPGAGAVRRGFGAELEAAFVRLAHRDPVRIAEVAAVLDRPVLDGAGLAAVLDGVVAAAVEWLPGVDRAAVRVRDLGHVFHSEIFVVPMAGYQPHVAEIEELRRRCQEVDWKTEDTVVVVTEHLPAHLVPPDQSSTRGTKT